MVNLDLANIILIHISIACYLFLLGHCIHRSSNYLLQVFCIVAVMTYFFETIFLFITPDRNLELARGTTACTISAIIEQYTPLVLFLLTSCMGINIWLLVVRGSKSTERSLLKWYCLFSFGVPVLTTAIAMVVLRRQDHNFTAIPKRYFCDFEDTKMTLWTFGLPTVMASIPSVLSALHTVIYLVRHHFLLRTVTNIGLTSVRNVPIEIGYCLRLTFFCVAFSARVIMLLVQQVVQIRNSSSKTDSAGNKNFADVSDFASCIDGIIVFIIFGTTRQALDTLGYLLSCGCIRTRLKRRRHRLDRRAERLGSTSSSLGRQTTGAMTLQEAMEVDLESNLSTLTSLPVNTTSLPLFASAVREMHPTMLSPAGIESPYFVYQLAAVPLSIYTPDFKNYSK